MSKAKVRELQELYAEVLSAVDGEGRINLALQVRLQETYLETEKWLNGSQGRKNTAAVKTVNQLLTLLRPFMATRATLDTVEAIHFDGARIWATDLDQGIEIWLDDGPEFEGSINNKDFRAIGKVKLADLETEVEPSYSYKITVKGSTGYDRHLFGDHGFESEQEAREAAERHIENDNVEQGRVSVWADSKVVFRAGQEYRFDLLAEKLEMDRIDTFDWQGSFSYDELERLAGIGNAAATDMTRPIFASLFFEVSGGQVKATAADGYRLMTDGFETGADELETALLPAQFVQNAVKTAKRIKADQVTVRIARGNDGRLHRTNSRVEIEMVGQGIRVRAWSKLFSGQVPGFERIVPDIKCAKTTFEVERAALAEVLGKAAKLAKESDNWANTNFQVIHGKLRIDVGEAGTLRIEGQADGLEWQAVRFNPVLLAGMIEGLSQERVTLYLADDNTPLRIDGPDGLLGLLMPMYQS